MTGIMKDSLFQDEYRIEEEPPHDVERSLEAFECSTDAKAYSTTVRQKTSLVLLVGSLVCALGVWVRQSAVMYQHHHTDRITYIAHLGNSLQFVNDFPRVHQRLATQPVFQDSMLHGSLSFVSMLKYGNGLKNRWKTSTAWNSTLKLYDYGACTVSQLLLGYDEYLVNYTCDEDYYRNDGKNPCFAPEHDNQRDDDAMVDDDEYLSSYIDDDGWQQDYDDSQAYLEYTLATKTRSNWDFVILSDHSARPAIPLKRQRSIQALNETYLPMLLEAGATPILMAMYGYWRPDINMTTLGISSVPQFTAKLYKGYQAYADAFKNGGIRPRIAPVGLAFLAVWEENPELWYNLFGPDYFHPSPHGTYLQACVVHATIFGYLPDPARSDVEVSDYFARSRSMQLGQNPLDLPTREEALYLRWIAQRVVLQKYIPPTFQHEYKYVLNDDNE